MCGFFAVFNKNLKKSNRENFLRSSSLLNHRGPDKKKFVFGNYFFLSHYRLSIIDLSSKGDQPFKDNNNRYYLIYNGEIYNYQNLKKILKEKYSFKSKTDTEVLLYSFKEWGVNCISKLKGMFSFAIWDDQDKTLYMSRDSFGQKQLYYFLNKDSIIISSEIKPILNYKKKIQLNEFTISDYLINNGYGLNNETFFKGVNQLPAGSYAIWNNGNLKVSKYFFYEESSSFLLPDLNKAKRLLVDNINQHLQSDVKIGIALSSGLDSNAILALVQKAKLKNKLVESFSIDFGNDFTEYNKVKNNLKKINCKLTRVNFFPEDLSNSFEKLIYFNEAPIGGLMNAALTKLFSVAKQNDFKVILSGMGADEMFMGYDSMKIILDMNLRDSMTLIDNTKIYNHKNLSKKILSISDEVLKKKEIYKFLFETKLPKNLHMMDRASMMNSIELRCPFVDYELFNFFSKLNLNNFINNDNSKIILRKIMKMINPKFNWFQKKISVQSPQNFWMKNTSLKNYFGDIVISNSIISRQFYNKKKLINYWDQFLKGKKNSALPIWQYANLFYLEKIFNEN